MEGKMKKAKEKKEYAAWQLILACFIFLVILIGTLIIGDRLILQNKLADLKEKGRALSDELVVYCQGQDFPKSTLIIQNYELLYEELNFQTSLPEGGQIRFNSDCEVAMAIYVDRNCAIKEFEKDDFRMIANYSRQDCVLEEEILQLCDYNCDLFGEYLNPLIAEIFPDGIKNTKKLPELTEDSLVRERIENNDAMEIILDYKVVSLKGFYVDIDNESILLLQGPFDFFPLQLEDKIAKNREVLLILFEEINEMINNDQYVWVFMMENEDIKCFREKLID